MDIDQQIRASDQRGEIRPAGPDDIVVANNLTKEFGEEFAVADLNFSIPPGTIFGMIGPSGSGKTTTVRLLTGIYAPTRGSVCVMGYDPSKFPRRMREKVGYMPQLFFLYPQLTVWENMNFMASLYGMNLFKRKRLKELLEFVELAGHENKLVSQLSGGMRRRLSLATTLVQDPTLIFLDEPTAGIDPVLRRKFWDHFSGLKEQGRTLIVTTQYVGEVAYCDLVGVMADGKLLEVDTPEHIRYHTYGGDMVDIQTENQLVELLAADISQLDFVRRILHADGHHMRVVVDAGNEAIPDLMQWFGQRRIEVKAIEEYVPSYDDVFIELIEKRSKNG